jgi:prolyl 4-hydroxylase
MSLDTLEARAKRGDAEAQLELGRQYETENNAKAARGWFATAAKAGNVAGLRLLGLNLLTQEPIEGESGVNMVRAAADKGDAEAACVCAVLAAGDTDLPDRWTVARRSLEIAAERGSSFARAQLDFLANSPPDCDPRALPRQEVFPAPRISVIEGCATAAECDWIIARARPHLHRAHVYDPHSGGSRTEGVRSNSSVEFGVARSDLILMRLRARIHEIVGNYRLEVSSILHYEPGQEFKPHFDFLDPVRPGHALDVEKNGQRVATFLIYLNEDFEGGETEFPKLDWRYKGRKGDAILFWNLELTGELDRRTLHAGLPPTSGEKWLFSQWLRRPPV